MMLPTGEIYGFWNEYISTLEKLVLKDMAGTAVFTYTRPSGTQQYRMLAFRKFYPISLADAYDLQKFLVFNESLDFSNPVIYPLYECLNPNIIYNAERDSAVLTFWANMETTFDNEDYDRSLVVKFEENNLANYSLTTTNRCLFSCVISFNQYKIALGPDGATEIIDVWPICSRPKRIFMMNEAYGMTDFATGGGLIPAQIVAKNEAFYDVTLYANGYGEASTGTGIAQILMLNYANTLPAGTRVLIASNYVTIVGGG